MEIKNLNSFKTVAAALQYEIKRQEKLLSEGENVTQETKLWDEKERKTHSMRSKEEAHDYRYFPDPDLPPLVINEETIEEIRSSLPELPSVRFERFCSDYNLPEYDAGVLTQEKELADFYEEVVAVLNEPKTVSNWVMGELFGILNEEKLKIGDCPFSPAQFAELLKLVKKETINAASAKNVLKEMFQSGKNPEDIVKEKRLSQIGDEGSIRETVLKVISDNPGPVEDYRKGKKKALSFLMGQVMKSTKGRANPKLVNKILIDKLRRGEKKHG